MDIYELSIDSNDASELVFPVPEQKAKLLEIVEKKVSNGLSAKNEWEEFLVLKREPKVDTDFCDIDDMGICILNEWTYKMLSPAFNQSVELLPLKSDDQTYYLVNVIETTDCLDRNNSDYTALGVNQIMSYNELSFHTDKITCPFFRIPELPFTILITGDVVELYHSQGLKGLNVSENEYVGCD